MYVGLISEKLFCIINLFKFVFCWSGKLKDILYVSLNNGKFYVNWILFLCKILCFFFFWVMCDCLLMCGSYGGWLEVK